MGIETEQRVRQLEQRLAALESGMQALQSQSLRPTCTDQPPVQPPGAKPAMKKGKSKVPACGVERRS